MIKIYCDRCEKELKEEYNLINIYKESTNRVVTLSDCANALSNAVYNMREDALKILNSKKMYCDECIEEIKKFIEGNK